MALNDSKCTIFSSQRKIRCIMSDKKVNGTIQFWISIRHILMSVFHLSSITQNKHLLRERIVPQQCLLACRKMIMTDVFISWLLKALNFSRSVLDDKFVLCCTYQKLQQQTDRFLTILCQNMSSHFKTRTLCYLKLTALKRWEMLFEEMLPDMHSCWNHSSIMTVMVQQDLSFTGKMIRSLCQPLNLRRDVLSKHTFSSSSIVCPKCT